MTKCAAVIVITHNLGVVARYADRVNVMYAGKVIETATAPELYANPRHPYTLGLLKSVPRLDEIRKEKLDPIEGMPPDLVHLGLERAALRAEDEYPRVHDSARRFGELVSERGVLRLEVEERDRGAQ